MAVLESGVTLVSRSGYDVKNHRVFLRRTKYDALRKEDFYVGNRINVFSRQLHLVDYGDQYTARRVGDKKEKTLAMIKPDAVPKMGSIMESIIDTGFTITKAKMVLLSRAEAMDFYSEHQAKSFFNPPTILSPFEVGEQLEKFSSFFWKEWEVQDTSDMRKKDHSLLLPSFQ
ncbi:nucleoside diphosphate kinase 7-like [Bufo gargarizans]|uniref:nucleoside diphosphate kinase 7-like n=1 Tax=Bufo gargarizans TaxID=30331 RepID=UPI001CF4E147|nr:nucleoside diphosphate kinase 7-like [Bufo gargarizans]